MLAELSEFRHFYAGFLRYLTKDVLEDDSELIDKVS